MRIRISAVFGVIVAAFLILCLLQAAPAEAQYTVTTGGVNVNTSDGAILSTACFYARSIAIRPDGKTAWGAEGLDGLLEIDRNRCAQFDELDNGFPSQAATYAADGRRLFVAGDNKLTTVDTITKRLLSSLEVFEPYAAYSGPFNEVLSVATRHAPGIVASPDGRFIYIPAEERMLAVVDAKAMQVLNVVDDVDYTNPGAVALKWSANEDEWRLYLGGSSGYFSVYNAATFELVTSFLVGEAVRGFPDSVTHMVLSPDNSRLYMTTTQGELLVLDTATNAIISTIALPAPASAVAVTPDGRHLFVPGLNTKNLFDVDALTGTLLNTIVVPDVSPFDPSMTAAIGRLTFASMTASATLTSGLYAPFSMSGTFSLADGRSIDPAHEDVTIAVSNYPFWFPAGSFVETTSGVFRCEGQNPSTGQTIDIEIRSTGGNSYAFTISGGGVDVDGEAVPLQALVVVGDDGGMATLDLNAGLQQTISSLQSDLSASQGQVASLTSQNNTLVQANADLNAQIAPLQQQVQALTAEVQPLTDQVATLTTLNASLTTENVRLTTDNTQLTATNTTLTTANADLTAANAQLTNDKTQLTAANGELTAQNTGLTTANANLTTANAQLTTDKAQLTAANITLTTANQDLQARNATLSARNARLATQLDAARQTIDNLRARIDQLQATIQQKDARIDDLKAKLDAANATIDTLRARIAALKNK